MKKITGCCFLILSLGLMSELKGRIAEAWSYQQMFDKADLVVIARVVATKDTDERSTLLDLNVNGVMTEFKTRLVLKGDKNITTFRLRHYRLEPEVSHNIANGPQLIRFSWEHPAFLLFLTKESDGRYVPVTGQTDPADLSVLELTGGAD